MSSNIMDLVTEKKIEYLLDEMTLEEKIGMIHGAGLFRTEGVKRLGIPALKTSDGPMGVRAEFEDASWRSLDFNDDLVTYCPSNTAIASTWNPQIAETAGTVLGEEARGRGKDMILAPGINIQRVPECGRNFEYMSEDPYLTATLCVPLIKGIQKSDVAACVKHFALNQQETERLWVNVEVDDAALRELYLPGFEAAVKEAGVYSVMGAYNLYHGKHCCENNALLKDILRDEWEYDGVVISDWGAVHDTKAAAESELDIEMSVTPDFDEYFLANPLKEKIQAGEIPEDVVNRKVRNILRLMFRINVMNDHRKAGSINSRQHQQNVLKAAEESIVLLKNEHISGEHLPIDPNKKEKILVVGDNAVRTHANGGGSAEIKALYEITPLLGMKMLLGGNVNITFTRGYAPAEKKQSDTNWQEDSLKEQEEDALAIKNEDIGLNEELAAEAVEMAKQADRVIFIGGLNHDFDIEGHDRSSLMLPYGQDALINRILEVNDNTTVVMISGSPVDMSAWKDKVKSLVWMSYAGMEGGLALAEVLFGKVNPSGHLAQTLPFENAKQFVTDEKENILFPGRLLTTEEAAGINAKLTQTYEEGRLVGYRYYDKKNIPVQYAFGFGLSYTKFMIASPYAVCSNKLAMLPSLPEKTELVNVNMTVENIGNRSGQAVVQVYVGRKHAAEDEPLRELKGYMKISIGRGEKVSAGIPLSARDFAHYDVNKKCFVVYDDEYEIYVGQSLDALTCCGTFRPEHEIICV